ncbi:MAG: hypothetical protein QXJ86_03660 [Nitrososphaerales archaeon]
MKRWLVKRLFTFIVFIGILALALYIIHLTQNQVSLFNSREAALIRNGGFEEGTLRGWGASVVDGSTDTSVVAVAKYEPYDGEYCLALVLDGRGRLVRVEPQIEQIRLNKIGGFSVAYRLMNNSEVGLKVTFLLKDTRSNELRSLIYILYNKGTAYIYYNETNQLVFNIGDANPKWSKIERNIIRDLTSYWVKDNPTNFIILNINIELYRATDKPFMGVVFAFIDEFTLKD